MCAKFWLVLHVCCVFSDAEASDSIVSVVRKQIFFGSFQDFKVNNSIEYIIDVTPQGDEATRPARVSLSSSGGDTTRPILITARQHTGAQTWQLPYEYGKGQRAFKLERTLCIYSSASVSETSDCANDEPWPRGQFTLHIASSCTADLTVSVQVRSEDTWQLPFEFETTLFPTLGAPAVGYYNFTENQERVRVKISSMDNACATVSVQEFTCPIPQTLAEVERSGMRMTVESSGAIQLSRNNFPNGFVVVVIVHDDDVVCEGEHHSDGNYLWQVADGLHDQPRIDPKSKDVKLIVEPALTRAQYAIGSVVLTVVFLSFYVVFGVFVFAQRFPKWNKLVAPKAVLQEPVVETENDRADLELQSATPHCRRRRDSVGTLDSSDNSDTDEEDEEPHVSTGTTTSPATPGTPRSVNSPAVPPNTTNENVAIETQTDSVAETTNTLEVTAPNQRDLSQSPRPFGLPPTLMLADLAKRKARTHQARSDRYLNTLYTVAVFYALPVVQFVAAFQMVLNVSGNLDICYYNFLCAHPAGVLSDFNHVFSNIGYLLLGALFMFQVRRRRMRRKKLPKHEDYGIPPHYGLLSALGAGMMVVALLSGSYHVCPNQLNFQFDTAFMYVLAVLSMVKIYQSRHPDVNARAHATFGVLAILIAMVVWGVLGGGALFWGFFTVLHIFSFLVLTLRIYYVGQFHLDKQGITEATRGFRASKRPLYIPRLVLLIIANCVNWVFAIYGLLTMSADFASHLLQVLLGNTLMYMIAYIILKLLNGERLRWYSWLYLAGASLAWAPSLYFFVYGNSSWSATPAQSRHRNHECKILEFYDSHDLWHILSAIALYLTFNVLLTWDDGLSAVKRTEIAVF